VIVFGTCLLAVDISTDAGTALVCYNGMGKPQIIRGQIFLYPSGRDFASMLHPSRIQVEKKDV
jgi:hypothetical protein